jgi:hypothetical protein
VPVIPVPAPADADGFPCADWTTVEEVQACPPGDKLDPAVIEAQIPVASEVLFNLNKRRYPGECTTTQTLCSTCRCRATCCCEPKEAVRLPGRYPALEVSSVIVDGVLLDPSAYILLNGRWLTRIDGGRWPRCNDVTDADSFEVEWVFGRAVTPGGRNAASKLVAEMGAACSNLDCQIPQRVTTIQREGVTYTIIDSFNMLTEGRTGVYEVDLWLIADQYGRTSIGGGVDPAARESAWST